ncbi:MAG: response regulator [Pseudodesulfovibrio sp.]|uniref:Response regulator receiver domain-containing protein n=1 Tax=Pseudodesulfovibrio indicus TaxID=1716143 RepID=A0A126QPR9_9BACT|nr:response regulator [Pseudodesulfovibrio indicus]AMK12060.1 two-component system response regulator [Pseudodesulfovibrio indicus]TDT88660.1 response regulator receiver domain-containing protein [Pseudodesulfovibrio indicus]
MSANATEGRDVRLLIVDDETGFAEVLCKRMRRRGVDATSAASGDEAVQLLRRSEFDVAIVDLKLQGMNGIEILKVFRLMAPEMPVLMLTGHGSEEARNECIKLGAAGYLSKPIDFDRLLEKALKYGAGRVQA